MNIIVQYRSIFVQFMQQIYFLEKLSKNTKSVGLSKSSLCGGMSGIAIEINNSKRGGVTGGLFLAVAK